MEETYLYLEFTFFCILVLMALLYRISHDPDQSHSNRAFRRVLISVLYVTILDCFWEGFNGSQIAYGRQINIFVNFLCLMSYGIIGYYWLAYVEAVLTDIHQKHPNASPYRWLPLALCIGMAVASLHSGWIIQFDENNRVQPGAAYPLIVILPCINLLMASYKVIRHYRTANNPQKKEDDIAMLSFLVLPLIGGIVSSINNDIPAIWPSCVLSLLIVYMSSLGHRISTDSLTGLNNRFRLDSYLSNLAAPGTSTDNIYLFICDLDNFKQINDTYGHYEGDQALREASDLLKRTTSRDDFLARYGGDEFVLISTCETYTAALDLRQKIQQAFQTHNIEANHSYQISLSIGLSSCASDIATVFQQADEFLYAEKHRKKSPLLS